MSGQVVRGKDDPGSKGVRWCPFEVTKLGGGSVSLVSAVWDEAKSGRVEYLDGSGVRFRLRDDGLAEQVV